jgi:hypothetical protein
MTRLGTLSEIEKLAQTVGREPAELAFLEEIPPQELRSLRVSIYERLYLQDRVLFERLALLGTRLPPRLGAELAEHVLGPLLTARVAAELPAAPVLAVARSSTPDFFADTAVYMDPRRMRGAITQLPVDTIVDVAMRLIGRGDYVTISRFIDFVTDEQTHAVIDAIDDEAVVLRVAFYMGSKNRMDHLFRSLPTERLHRMVIRVQEEPGLLPALLSVLIHVSYSLKRELGDVVASQDQSVVTGYIRATQDAGLWSDLLPVVATMSPQARRTVVDLPILLEPEVQQAIINTADEHQQWGIVLGLVDYMGETGRDAVAAALNRKGPGTLGRAADAALLGEHWDTLIDLVRRLPETRQAELTRIVKNMFAGVDDALLQRIAAKADHLKTVSRSGASV